MNGKMILVCDPVHESGLRLLEEEGFTVKSCHGSDDPSINDLLPEANALIVRSGTTVDADVLSRATSLEVIGRAGIGVDNIDLDEATRHGVVVMNTPMGNTRSAAEHAIALMFAVARNIPEADREVRTGHWPRKKLTGRQLRGKTLALVGLGKVGSEVAGMANGLGMQVLAVDPFLSEEKAEELNVTLVELDDALQQCDFLSIHTPLTDKTRGMIGSSELEMMKSNASLINCARGGIVDEDDLYEVLKSKRIAAAGIDTFRKEPPENSPLLELDNTVLTPHLGASTEEAQEKVSTDIANQLIDYFSETVIRNAVNIVSVGDPAIRPYMSLAKIIGEIASQTSSGSVEEVEITLSGAISEFDPEPLSLSALQGVLSTFSDQVNLVNAKVISRDRGIDLVESRTEHSEDFESSLFLNVTTSGGTTKVGGTVFEDGDPRLIQFNDLKVDVKPSSRMLFMEYPDVPGQVGKFGTVLGDHDINIASMEVGRKARGENAVVILTLDDPVPEEVQQELKDRADVGNLWYLEMKS